MYVYEQNICINILQWFKLLIIHNTYMLFVYLYHRVYEIMNANYTSGVSFTEFVNFCSTYLVLDEGSLMTFTFKLMSRRGELL